MRKFYAKLGVKCEIGNELQVDQTRGVYRGAMHLGPHWK